MDPTKSEPSLRAAQTVVGLFDDQIDAERALAALRKQIQPASNVSVLARDRRVSDQRSDSPVDVTRAAVDTAMTAVTGWLSGLAALMVPEQGHFLAAGPIGAVLSKIRPEHVSRVDREGSEPPAVEPVSSVGLTLERFGFRPEEAHYLEQRLAAGSSMIAVTAVDQPQVDATLRTFGDNDAVFIGQAETPVDVIAEAQQGLRSPMIVDSADVIVADLVVPMRNVCRVEGAESELTMHCGADVHDEHGTRLGEVDDLLLEEATGAVRYVIVGHGGLLGIARRRYAIPAELARIGGTPVQITVGDRKLSDLEAFDPHEPFSQKHERAVIEFFGLEPYWER
jgi:hypothetical protein